jgi:hypothetical protein
MAVGLFAVIPAVEMYSGFARAITGYHAQLGESNPRLAADRGADSQGICAVVNAIIAICYCASVWASLQEGRTMKGRPGP